VEEYLSMDSIKDNSNIRLTNVSGIHGAPISEHAFAMLLALTRKIKPAILNQEKKEWAKLREERPLNLIVLDGKTMLLAGLGSIGLETAKKAKAFGMKTIGLKRLPEKRPKDPHYIEYVDEIVGHQQLAEAVSVSDVIVDSLPLTSDTRGLFDSKVFQAMKKGAIFVNVGRGKTVVEQDLVQALVQNRLYGACLDVFAQEPLPKESSLWRMSNVIISPHISGWSSEYDEKALVIFRENLTHYTKGEELRNVVDKISGY
jgi:phosphoglycerate dehydrogenase-like enzyme